MLAKRFLPTALAVVVLLAITGFVLVSTLSGSSEAPGDADILERGDNMNLALSQARNGMGAILGEPTAIYGGIMPYRDALEAIGSNVAHEGSSQRWRLDRPVYLYVFEGPMHDPDPRVSNITDWAQKFVTLDAETGSPFLNPNPPKDGLGGSP